MALKRVCKDILVVLDFNNDAARSSLSTETWLLISWLPWGNAHRWSLETERGPADFISRLRFASTLQLLPAPSSAARS